MVVDGAIRWLGEFKVAVCVKAGSGNNNLDDSRWKPLDRGKLIINVDVATNNRVGTHGLGVIIRDSTRVVICARAIHWPFSI